ncbi:uncharacterized protein EV422DRAFT_203070 [Fimicolochytrium jonesii]|uniref:uncharacterized protein n=1 Tax=Fimicolochytrium jonesii TaxID=1396493 RepID=UPI0022FE3A9D|nr:uncharacterized protein EV422DRAFT_203070 [Fimicolochytrium jonesii]KAI8818022.1 hypothetical protein EV422DRAFT_203070 [Fimicolochytrium jonesii]
MPPGRLPRVVLEKRMRLCPDQPQNLPCHMNWTATKVLVRAVYGTLPCPPSCPGYRAAIRTRACPTNFFRSYRCEGTRGFGVSIPARRSAHPFHRLWPLERAKLPWFFLSLRPTSVQAKIVGRLRMLPTPFRRFQSAVGQATIACSSSSTKTSSGRFGSGEARSAVARSCIYAMYAYVFVRAASHCYGAKAVSPPISAAYEGSAALSSRPSELGLTMYQCPWVFLWVGNVMLPYRATCVWLGRRIDGVNDDSFSGDLGFSGLPGGFRERDVAHAVYEI